MKAGNSLSFYQLLCMARGLYSIAISSYRPNDLSCLISEEGPSTCKANPANQLDPFFLAANTYCLYIIWKKRHSTSSSSLGKKRVFFGFPCSKVTTQLSLCYPQDKQNMFTHGSARTQGLTVLMLLGWAGVLVSR